MGIMDDGGYSGWVDDDDDHWFENGDSFETKVCFFALRRGEKKMM